MKKRVYAMIILAILLISLISYYKLRFLVERDEHSFISNKVIQVQLPDGSFPEFENHVDLKTHLYTTYYLKNLKNLIDNKKNEIKLSDINKININSLNNIYYMCEIGTIFDFGTKEKIKNFIRSNQKDNGIISIYDELYSKDQQQKDRLILGDTYYSIKILNKIGVKINKEQLIKKWLINLLSKDYIINSPDTLKLVYDSLKMIDSNFEIKYNIMENCVGNYFSKFQINSTKLISGLIDLDSATYLANKINFKIKDTHKKIIASSIKEISYKNCDDVFFIYFTTSILNNIKALDYEYKQYVLNKVEYFDKFKMKNGTYSRLPSKSTNVLTTYYGMSILDLVNKKSKNNEQLKIYIDNLVNKKKFELQKKVFNDAEGLYCLLNLINEFNIDFNSDIKKAYIDNLKLYFKFNVDDPNIRQLFYAVKALNLLNYVFNEDDNKVIQNINDNYLSEKGIYNFPNKKSLIYSSMMISIHDDMNLDKKHFEKSKEIFIEDIKKSTETISLFYSISSLQIIDNHKIYTNKIDKNFLDSFKCENGYVLNKNTKATFLYPTMCGIQISKLIKEGKSFKYY